MLKSTNRAATSPDGQIAVQNINHPGSSKQVDAERYGEMKRALLALLPKAAPGLTLKTLSEQLPGRLEMALFEMGAGPGWWLKTVQLDLEAQGILVREPCRPLRFHQKAKTR